MRVSDEMNGSGQQQDMRHGDGESVVGKRYPRYIDRPSGLVDRGYSCVALDRPTDAVNVGHALRASFCFSVRLLILGDKDEDIRIDRLVTDPMRTYRHVPVVESDSILSVVPHGCSIVSIEFSEDAIPLMDFVHPERACYVFGPESDSVSSDILARSDHKVMIPTNASLNLGMTVNVVLYDRLAKGWTKIRSRRNRLLASGGPWIEQHRDDG